MPQTDRAMNLLCNKCKVTKLGGRKERGAKGSSRKVCMRRDHGPLESSVDYGSEETESSSICDSVFIAVSKLQSPHLLNPFAEQLLTGMLFNCKYN